MSGVCTESVAFGIRTVRDYKSGKKVKIANVIRRHARRELLNLIKGKDLLNSKKQSWGPANAFISKFFHTLNNYYPYIYTRYLAAFARPIACSKWAPPMNAS